MEKLLLFFASSYLLNNCGCVPQVKKIPHGEGELVSIFLKKNDSYKMVSIPQLLDLHSTRVLGGRQVQGAFQGHDERFVNMQRAPFYVLMSQLDCVNMLGARGGVINGNG